VIDARLHAMWGADSLEERRALAATVVTCARRAGDTELERRGLFWRFVALMEAARVSDAESALADYGRARALKLHEIPHAEAARLYQEHAGLPLPLSAEALREVTRADLMVAGRKGRGGSQPAEVARMLRGEITCAAADREWVERERARLAAALSSLDARISALAASA